jgi:hypothetical protein
MTTQSMMDLDSIYNSDPILESKILYKLFEKNDCESYLMSFQTIKKILKGICKGSVTESNSCDIDWNNL